MTWSAEIAPLLPLWLIAGAAGVALLFLALSFWRRQRGALLRTVSLALLVLALLNPSLTETDREELPGIVAVVVDESTSQAVADRVAFTRQVREALEQSIGRFRELDVRWTTADGSGDGTVLFQALNQLLADVPPDRIAGAIMVTDGQVHDVPDNAGALGFKAPLHALITAKADERDRRLILHRAPRFGIVGQSQPLTFRVEDLVAPGGTPPRPGRVGVTIRRDGEHVVTQRVTLGDNVTVPVEITHGGENIIEIEVEPLEGELTAANNRAVISTEGIRENLRVLLVSGEPHAGERTWRNLLKSDPAVDLVHFTILRPPEKQDGTPINQLSLIAFPTRELFSVKIDEFDLIIFDRYQRRGVLPIIYFDNIARYVRDGGAVLVAAGPDFATSLSLYRSPMAPILPAEPTGNVLEQPFHARITDTGKRHPVTRGLPGGQAEPPQWGRWFRTVEARPDRGHEIMNGPGESPLLVLSREDEGRVALMLSDHAWLWSRGFEGGGPQVALLRRLSHWLMKEPDLEEEHLSGASAGGKLIIERRTMEESTPPVRVTDPTGAEQTVTLEEAEPGLWRASVEAAQVGLYRLTDGELTALANVGPLNPRELADVIATEDKLANVVQQSGGAVTWLREGSAIDVPRINLLRDVRRWGGEGWMGLKRTDSYLIRGIRTVPLITGILGLAALLLALTAMWYREGR